MTSDSERIISQYQRHAEAWARARGSNLYEKPWLDRFLALLRPGASILDLGCGSGEPASHYLIDQGYRVCGVDSSPALIGMCQARFPDGEWIVADMRRLALDRRFDGILAWDSFFHLCPQDQRPMFSIFKMYAAPMAGLMFTSGPTHGEAIGTFEGEPLYHGSLDPEEYRSLLGENGFDVRSHMVADPDCGLHTIWLAQGR